MGDIFGGSNRIAPHTVDTVSIGSTVEIEGSPQYISVKAVFGTAEVIFESVTPGVEVDGWTLSDGETVDWLVQASRPYLHVIAGTVIVTKS